MKKTKRYMWHKTIQLFFIILITLAISGCEKVFTEDEMNKLSVDTYDDLVFAMAGLNYRFASMAEGNLSGFLANADDVTTNTGIMNGGLIDHCIQMSASSSLSEYDLESVYKPLYQTISCANDILSKIGNLNKVDHSIQHVLGEIYFMRAYSYFWLARIYGQIPLIDNVNVNYTIKKASFNEIYSFIEKDLQQAIGLLPNSSNEARIKYVTPHRGTAKALLSQVYLTMAGYPLKDTKMYVNAAKLAGEVIDSAAYFGFGLMPDLADLWNGKHRINKESMFSIFSTSPIRDWSDYKEYPWKYKYYATDLHFSSYNGGDVYDGGDVAIQFYNTFPKSYRKDVTYRTLKIYFHNAPCVTDSLNPLNTYCPPPDARVYYVDSMNLCTDMSFRKQASNFDKTNSDHGIESIPISDSAVISLLRYSHVLLTYAEAKARSGNLDASAFEAVNQIRRRANKVDIFSPSVYDMKEDISPEQFADSVVWERAWEFCNEPEGRWFDLLRLEMLKNLKNLKYPGQGEVWPVTIPGNYFFPIPQSDKMLNTNL